MSVEFKGMNTSTERAGSSFSGYPMLLFILALLVLVVWNVAGNIPPDGAAKASKPRPKPAMKVQNSQLVDKGPSRPSGRKTRSQRTERKSYAHQLIMQSLNRAL